MRLTRVHSPVLNSSGFLLPQRYCVVPFILRDHSTVCHSWLSKVLHRCREGCSTVSHK